jgi:hypothetical protein
MNIFNYLTIYLVIGTFLMLMLDLSMIVVRKVAEQQDDLKSLTEYSFGERLYIVMAWPHFLFNLIAMIISSSKNKNE